MTELLPILAAIDRRTKLEDGLLEKLALRRASRPRKQAEYRARARREFRTRMDSLKPGRGV